MRPLLLILLTATLAACQAAPTATELRVRPGQYGAAFDAARDVLRDYNYTLNRVDGRAGVISTYTRSSAGLATPWDHDQTTFEQETDDFVEYHQRRIRITFEPAGGASPAPGDLPPPDLRTLGSNSETVMRVQVVLEKIERPIWRPDTSGVASYTHALDPDLARRGMAGSYSVPEVDDRPMAARLVEEISGRLDKPDSRRERPAPPS